MKSTILVLLLIGLASAADKPPAKKSAPSASKVRVITVPAGAVEVEPYTYRYTGPDGKKWLYRKTPFGIVRNLDLPSEKPLTDQSANVQASDAGDSVRFERSSPFGPVKWERKKNELTEMERAVWEREQARAAQKD